jgi:hypothetical protein
MATALSIITDAMVEIGAYAPGDTISNVHQQLGLLRFQNQLNAWQADDLTLNLQTPLTFSLTSGTSTFTIGPTGSVVSTRPVYIEGMNYVIPGTTPTTEVPMGELSDDAYMALSQKTLPSSLPQMYHVNATMPNLTIFVWPEVTQTVSVVIYAFFGIDVPAALNSSVTGPQGYAEAFMYQLALRLCGPMSRPIPPELPALAANALALMKRPQEIPGMMGVDAALVPSYGGAFNVLTGTNTGSSNR